MASEGTGVAEAAAIRRAGRGSRRGETTQNWLTIFPLLTITVLIYNLLALFGGTDAATGAPRALALMDSQAFSLTMASGAVWQIAWGDVLVIISLFLLFAELLKSTGSGSMEIFNHALSMFVFIICLVEFLLIEGFASSTFFVIMLMTLLDVLAGVIVTINSARRDIGLEQ